MSFWDSLKPKKPSLPACTAVDLADDRSRLTLSWDDGRKVAVTGQSLRQLCPCAECVEEFTGQRKLDPASVPAGLSIVEVQTVGNYAVSFTFGDGHRTGIYNWEYLRTFE